MSDCGSEECLLQVRVAREPLAVTHAWSRRWLRELASLGAGPALTEAAEGKGRPDDRAEAGWPRPRPCSGLCLPPTATVLTLAPGRAGAVEPDACGPSLLLQDNVTEESG